MVLEDNFLSTGNVEWWECIQGLCISPSCSIGEMLFFHLVLLQDAQKYVQVLQRGHWCWRLSLVGLRDPWEQISGLTECYLHPETGA